MLQRKPVSVFFKTKFLDYLGILGQIPLHISFPYLPNGDSEIYLSGLQSQHLVSICRASLTGKVALASRRGLPLLPRSLWFSPPLEGPSGREPCAFLEWCLWCVFIQCCHSFKLSAPPVITMSSLASAVPWCLKPQITLTRLVSKGLGTWAAAGR